MWNGKCLFLNEKQEQHLIGYKNNFHYIANEGWYVILGRGFGGVCTEILIQFQPRTSRKYCIGSTDFWFLQNRWIMMIVYLLGFPQVTLQMQPRFLM